MEEIKDLDPAYLHIQYLIRRKVLKLFGGEFYIYDENENLLFYSKQKAFKLREDIRIYADKNETRELLIITTSQIIDYAATYNVRDATTGEVVGALRRKGLKSHLWRDEWAIISKEGSEIGVVTETNNLLTRFIGFIPQKYDVLIYNCEVAKIKQHFNPFVLKYTMTILDESAVDPRLLIVAGILLAAIEGRQT